ncbi:hypothetical protein LIER_17458 [Lithospermum erythrorhizon]|uniref:Uncharacterized protein n=1 Tax=Lithospermum erythrorhizon TaxID=34254 RepID=A0AAV3QCR2_LITER
MEAHLELRLGARSKAYRHQTLDSHIPSSREQHIQSSGKSNTQPPRESHPHGIPRPEDEEHIQQGRSGDPTPRRKSSDHQSEEIDENKAVTPKSVPSDPVEKKVHINWRRL